jgi:hypothetical protein
LDNRPVLPAPAIGILVPDAGAEAVEPTWRAVHATVGENTAVHVIDRAGLRGFLAETAPADLVLLRAPCIVGAGWLEGLRAAAGNSPHIATAFPLHIGGPPLDSRVAEGLPANRTPDEASAAVRRAPTRPVGRRPLPACLYVPRAVVDLCSPPVDDAEGFLGELLERTATLGLVHVLADDVLVVLPREPEDTPVDDPDQAVGRAARQARRRLRGLRVTIDGRCLTPGLNGTKLQTLETARSLAAADGIARVRVVHAHDLPDWTRRALTEAEVELLAEETAGAAVRDDVVHRPFQVSSDSDLELLPPLGERLVVTQQDLINYFALPTGSPAGRLHRRLTRRALAAADHVVFFSAHIRTLSARAGLLTAERSSVVPLGTDHALDLADDAPSAGAVPDGPYLLWIGNDLPHKNRGFAERLHTRLAEHHGWDGPLLLVGVEATGAPGARALGEVPGRRLVELIRGAEAVLYPTAEEGFGLVPYEAARLNTPTVFAPLDAFLEHVPGDYARIVPWNVQKTAERVAALLREPDERRALTSGLAHAAEPLTWAATAAALVDAYDHAASAPVRDGVPHEQSRAEATRRGLFGALRAPRSGEPRA